MLKTDCILNMHVISLLTLADSSLKKDMQEFGIFGDSATADELKAAIDKRSAEKRAAAIDRSAEFILSLGEQKERVDEQEVIEIRQLRGQIAKIKEGLQRRKDAAEYGSKTLNYLPLANMLGLITAKDLAHIDKEFLEVKPLPDAGSIAAPSNE